MSRAPNISSPFPWKNIRNFSIIFLLHLLKPGIYCSFWFGFGININSPSYSKALSKTNFEDGNNNNKNKRF